VDRGRVKSAINWVLAALGEKGRPSEMNQQPQAHPKACCSHGLWSST
jgi:hypothetical protein